MEPTRYYQRYQLLRYRQSLHITWNVVRTDSHKSKQEDDLDVSHKIQPW